MPVHLYGNMVDIKKLHQKIKLLKKRIYIIEDSLIVSKASIIIIYLESIGQIVQFSHFMQQKI